MSVLKLKFLRATELARYYEDQRGTRQWVPKKVSRLLVEADLHQVAIEDWWLKENPFIKPESSGQTILFGD